MRVLEHLLHHPNCCAEKATGDPSSPSGTGPVQLVATSPKATRLKDVRTWQPQVPRWGGLEVCRIEVLVLVSNFEMVLEFGMTLVCTCVRRCRNFLSFCVIFGQGLMLGSCLWRPGS